MTKELIQNFVESNGFEEEKVFAALGLAETEEECDEKELKRLAFWFEVYSAIETNEAKEDVELEDFMRKVYRNKKKGEKIWLMAERGGIAWNRAYKDLEEAIKMMEILNGMDVNAYFTSSMCRGKKRCDRACKHTNVIFCDIDDAPAVSPNASEEELREVFKSVYRVTEKMLPTYIVRSGHGLHLYWVLEETLDIRQLHKRSGEIIQSKGSLKRRELTESIVTYFKADRACLNKSRILRVPGSKNVKKADDIKKTELIWLNDKSFALEELEFFKRSEEEVELYRLYCNAEKARKARETREKNGTVSKRGKKKEVAVKEKAVKEKVKKEKVKEVEEEEESTGFSEQRVYVRKNASNDLKLIADLKNWAINRGGVRKGYRQNFCVVYASVARRAGISVEETVETCKKYVVGSFKTEEKVRYIYNQNFIYMYRNETIAKLLGFTEEEKELGYAAYTEEQRKERKRERKKEWRDREYKKERWERAKEKSERDEEIKNFAEQGYTAEQIAEMTYTSKRTVERIKAKKKLEKNRLRDELVIKETKKGKTGKEIAENVGVSLRTVRAIQKKHREENAKAV